MPHRQRHAANTGAVGRATINKASRPRIRNFWAKPSRCRKEDMGWHCKGYALKQFPALVVGLPKTGSAPPKFHQMKVGHLQTVTPLADAALMVDHVACQSATLCRLSLRMMLRRCIHGGGCNVEHFCNLVGGTAFGHQFEHLPFTHAQAHRTRRTTGLGHGSPLSPRRPRPDTGNCAPAEPRGWLRNNSSLASALVTYAIAPACSMSSTYCRSE